MNTTCRNCLGSHHPVNTYEICSWCRGDCPCIWKPNTTPPKH